MSNFNRRRFLKGAATKAAGGAIAGIAAGCAFGQTPAADELAQAAQDDSALPELNWDMPTSWPVSLETIYGGAAVFAERVGAMTQGRFQINARAAGEVAGGTEVLNVVEQGAFPCGHTASYYYIGRSPVMGFGTALPFGMTARQQNSWLFEGGGLETLQEFYADRFNMIFFPAGNTGVQMGGWFNREINSLADMEGLNMRIPGLGGQVMDRLGVTVTLIAGGEIFQALQTGAIDAAEFVGPYDDEKLGFQRAADFYYYPGWWEPGPSLEVQFNLDDWNGLPEVYQEIVKTAAHEANTIMLARYDALNPVALQKLLDEGVTLLPFPDDVMAASKEAAFGLYDEFSSSDSDFSSIFEEWNAFRQQVQQWHSLAELSVERFNAQSSSEA